MEEEQYRRDKMNSTMTKRLLVGVAVLMFSGPVVTSANAEGLSAFATLLGAVAALDSATDHAVSNALGDAVCYVASCSGAQQISAEEEHLRIEQANRSREEAMERYDKCLQNHDGYSSNCHYPGDDMTAGAR
jgi:hypothetical protein